MRQWAARRYKRTNQGPALSKSNSSPNKIAWGWQGSGGSPGPSSYQGSEGSLPWKGGQEGVQAGCGSEHVSSRHLLSSVCRCLPGGYFLSLTLPVCLFPCHQYLFLCILRPAFLHFLH